jgi:hypothetical protein
MTQDVDLDLEVPTLSSTSRGSKRGCNYNHDEGIQLCMSWMNVSNDPVVGNDQARKNYWTRIADHCNENKTSALKGLHLLLNTDGEPYRKNV